MGLFSRIKDWDDGDVLTEPDLEAEFDNIYDSVVAGTTTAVGMVQLEDSHASTSVTKAACPKNVKEAYDKAVGVVADHSDISSSGADIEDAVDKKHAANTDTALGAQSENLDMNTHKVVGVVDPTADQEAATKKYVDDNAGSGGGLDWSLISTNTNAVTAHGYLINASAAAITLTLPGSPSVGDTVGVCDVYNKATTNTITIDRNTKNIESSAENLIVDVNGAGFTLVFTDATRGWEIVTEIGGIGSGGTVDTFGTPIDNDFAKFTDADTIEGRSKAEVLSDLNVEDGATKYPDTGEQAFLDADHTKLNAIEASADVTDATNVNSAGAVMEADFNAKGNILSASANDTPLILAAGANTKVLTANSAQPTGLEWADAGAPGAHKDSHDPADGADPLDTANASEIAGVQAAGTGSSHSLARADHQHQIQHSIADNHIVTIDHATVADNDYAKFTVSGLEGRSKTEMLSDLNVVDGATKYPDTGEQTFLDADHTKLNGIETSADITDAVNIASSLHGVTAKGTPVNADELGLLDSATSWVLKKFTFTNLKAFLKTYFDTLYNLYVHPNHSGPVTSAADGATTITDKAVTLAKMNDMATASLLGRNTAATGVPEVLSKATALSLLNVEDGATADNISDANVTDLTDGFDTILHDHDGISENTSARHTQGTDTGLGILAADINMGTHKLTALSVPSAAGHSIRATASITEAALEDGITKKHAAGGDTDLDSTFEATFLKKAAYNANTFLYAVSDDTPMVKTRAETLALLSGQANASFDMNSQAITKLGNVVTTHTPGAAGTATLDLDVSRIHDITMPAGNITIAISNENNGNIFTIRILQDGTGSRTVTWFSTIKWAGGSAPTLTTTANKTDTVIFRVTGTDTYDGFVVGKNV